MNQDDKTDQKIGDDDGEDTAESTFLSDITEDNLDHQQELLHLGQVRLDKALCTTMVPLPKKRSRADTGIARPPLSNSRNLHPAMALPLLSCEKSSFLNKLSESNYTPSARALVVPNKSSGDRNIPQPKASGDQNIPQHQK